MAGVVPGYSWFVLFLLVIINTQQLWSRYSFNYLYNVSSEDPYVSMKVDVDLSYGEYGFLTGYGFSSSGFLTGLVAGRAADVWTRTLLIGVGCFIWNGALFMIGASTTFSEMVFWRLALGFGQAFTGPASYSLIADYFPESQRSQANGLFACGIYLGGGLASVCIPMSARVGWRATCAYVSAIGLGLAFVEVCGVIEPKRSSDKSAGSLGANDFLGAMATIFRNRLARVVFAASAARFMGGYAIAGYLPTYYGVIFPSHNHEYAYINAYVVALGGFLSSRGSGVTVSASWNH